MREEKSLKKGIPISSVGGSVIAGRRAGGGRPNILLLIKL